MILLLIQGLAFIAGGGLVAARGLGDFKPPGQRPFVIAGGGMVVFGVLLIAAMIVLVPSLTGFVL